MADRRFEFLHASDLHLGQPLGGMPSIPEPWIPGLLDAPYDALRRVVDIALERSVAFVVFTGDLIDFSSAPPRAVECLLGQLQRLDAASIAAYWLDGKLEQRSTFPDDVILPNSVERLTGGALRTIEVSTEGSSVWLLGRPSGVDFDAGLAEIVPPDEERLWVGLWYSDREDDLSPGPLDHEGIAYWACGGRKNPQGMNTPVPAYYAGSPQGRQPCEHGPHGCQLVTVDGSSIESHFLETDVVRYQIEHLILQGRENASQMLMLMSRRLREIRDQLADGRRCLVYWEIVDDGPVGRTLRDDARSDRLLSRVQEELHAETGDSIWTVGLRSSRTTIPAGVLKEDTILGEFLRNAQQMLKTSGDGSDIRSLLTSAEVDALAAGRAFDDSLTREQLLVDATALGLDLLSGEST